MDQLKMHKTPEGGQRPLSALVALLAVVGAISTGCATVYRGLSDFSATPKLSWSGERLETSEEPKPQAPKFDWPVDEARMTRGFLNAGRGHWGLDLANRKGTPILAAADGVVIYTGKGFRGYGKLVVIEHNDEWATLYAHLDRIHVREGQKITRGDKLGAMGRTGRASGVHLHFEIRHHRQPVNPLALLPETPQTQRVVVND
jgi:murein DD-endopeptidase MepM/ murein hydrolase activator NlpD